MRRLLPLLLALLGLAACGDLPRPFAGNPGATARRLSVPPPARLAVPTPTNAMLDDAAAPRLADALAHRLDDLAVPAFAGPAHPGDWGLRANATLAGSDIQPGFTLFDSAGKEQGHVSAHPVPAADWSQASPATLDQLATAAAPNVSALLTRLQALRAQSDPNSLLNRAPRVFIGAVTGAPGDGNRALAVQLRSALGQSGALLVDDRSDADITVRAEIHVVDENATTQRVEVQWIVESPRGERGRVVQVNEVPHGTLDGLWGDVALVVARQAATGIRRIIETSSGGGPVPPLPAGVTEK